MNEEVQNNKNPLETLYQELSDTVRCSMNAKIDKARIERVV